MTRTLSLEVAALEEQARHAERDARRAALEEIIELMDDLDRGVIDLAELRAEIERRALNT